MEEKALKFQIKAVNEDGTFEGVASTYGPPQDTYGDIIERGSFAKTIKDHDGEIVVLWQHDSSEPIGKGFLEDSARGLLIRGRLELGLATARKAYTALKADLVRGLSIGYRAVQKEVRDNVRYLQEIALIEISLVTFAANSRARVETIKRRGQERSPAELQRFVNDVKRELEQLHPDCVLGRR